MRRNILHLILLVCSLFLFQCHYGNGDGLVDDGVTTIAVYSDEGAAEACVTAAVQMFRWMGYTVETIGANDINSGNINRYDILYFPGGYTPPYQQRITEAGRVRIKQLIQLGVGFIGTCAGAMYAGEDYTWQVHESSSGLLGIFPGTTAGPIDEIYPLGQYGMCQVNFSQVHPITASELDSGWIMYYAGPYFIADDGADIDTIGTYDITGQPALVAFEYGQGRVFLTGPHPEWEEDSDRDSVSYFDEFDDRGSDWDLMRNAARWCLHEID